MRRLLLPLVVALAALGSWAPAALGHAVLDLAVPKQDTAVASPPATVVLRFTEPVQLLRAQDLTVVDDTGASVASGPGTRSRQDAASIEIPVRPDLEDGTYTVRYQVLSADAHLISGAYAFAVGSGPVGEPFLGGAGPGGGPSETGPWAVSARFLELVGIGGLLGLLAFRWLVWRPAWSRPPALADEERTAALGWGRDLYWVAFGTLALGAMVAEVYLLLVKSASALGTSVAGVLRDPGGITSVLAGNKFGSLLQLRGILLFALFALGAWQFLAEYGREGDERAPAPTGAAWPAAAMGALLVVVLGSISYQGHASQAPAAALSIAADAIHLVAVSVWIGGLAFTALALWRLPRAVPGGPGRAVAAAALARFSRLALLAVAVAVATGVARSVGQLSDPAQLWETGYGRSIVYKLLLLAPIAFVALHNRRVVTALRRVRRPNRPTISLVRRSAALELGLSLAVVVVASLLVAQVPGRV